MAAVDLSIRRRWDRWRHLTAAGFRLWREQGTAALIRRSLLRHDAGTRRLSRFRVLLDTAWQRTLQVPEPVNPEVSIIIPAHDAWRSTYRCLASVIRTSGGANCEVILVDDASTDCTREAANIVRGLKIVRSPRRIGVEAACNAGAARAAGRFVLFLSSDSVTMSGWIESMRAVFERRPHCAAVGAMLLDRHGRLRGEGDDPSRPEYNYLRQVDFCPATALMVRRDVFAEIGGFGEGVTGDVDLCAAIRGRGWSVWYQPAAQIHQLRSAARGSSAFRVRDRSAGPAVLVVDHQVPMFDRDAGSLFMTRFLNALSAAGYRTVFWPDNLLRTTGYAQALQANGIEVLYGSLSFDEYIRTNGDKLSFAVVYRSAMAVQYLPVLEAAKIPAGYIAVDLEYVREARRMEVDRDPGVSINDLRERERTIIRAARCVGVHSPVEAEILRNELDARSVIEIPLPLTSIREDSSPGFANRSGLLFLGSMHPPNVDAARHLAERLLPHIRRRIENIRLSIAGDVRGGVRDLARTGVIRVPGHVDDLSECFDRHRVFVAPVRFGAGLKGKILEAMNHGIPVVTTPIGAEGIGLTHRENAMIAEDDNAFVDHVVELYSDPELWTRIHDASRRFIQERFSERAFREAVDQFLSCLGKQPATPSRSEKQGASGEV